MQKAIITIISVATILLSASCNKTKNPASSKLTNLKDSASYAMGIILGHQYMDEQMDTLLNGELTLNGITDLMKYDTTLLSVEEAANVMRDFSRVIMDQKYGANKKAGEDFLVKNQSNTGVNLTPSGLQYSVITEGNGSAHPSYNDIVKIKFKGYKIDGTLFGDTGETPIETNFMNVPKGVAEGILLMTPGAKYKFYLPYYLAFGEAGYQTVEPYSTVIFDVELVEIVKK